MWPRSIPPGGGEYGEQYPPRPLLEKGEVVLTFDDGPHPIFTPEILAALDAQCTKATFFSVGRMLKNFPDVARQVQAEGHTVGTHTYTHLNLGGTSLGGAEQQIESTINIAEATLPNGVAPFFRFPYLSDPKRVRDYLAKRNIAVFGIDVDSFDWRVRTPEKVMHNVFTTLDKTGARHHPVPRHPRQYGQGHPRRARRVEGAGLQGRAHRAEVAHRSGGHGRARRRRAAPPRPPGAPHQALTARRRG